MTNEEIQSIKTLLADCLGGGRGFEWGQSCREDGEPFATVEEIAEHLAQCARLSGERRPGPHALNLWTVHVDGEGEEVGKSIIVAHTGNGPTSEAHARFFASAPWIIMVLLDEVERLREGEAVTDPVRTAARALIDKLSAHVRVREGPEYAALRAALDAPGATPSERDRALVRAWAWWRTHLMDGETVDSIIAAVNRTHPPPDTRALCLRVAEAVRDEAVEVCRRGVASGGPGHSWRLDCAEDIDDYLDLAIIVDRVLRGGR